MISARVIVNGEGFLARRASVRDGKRARFEVEAYRRSAGVKQSCRPTPMTVVHRESAAIESEERGGQERVWGEQKGVATILRSIGVQSLVREN